MDEWGAGEEKSPDRKEGLEDMYSFVIVLPPRRREEEPNEELLGSVIE